MRGIANMYLHCCVVRGTEANSHLVAEFSRMDLADDAALLETYDASNNFLGTHNVQAVCDVLLTLRRLRSIAFRNQRLTVEGVKAICDLCEEHPTIERVDLRGNELYASSGRYIQRLMSRTPRIWCFLMDCRGGIKVVDGNDVMATTKYANETKNGIVVVPTTIVSDRDFLVSSRSDSHLSETGGPGPGEGIKERSAPNPTSNMTVAQLCDNAAALYLPPRIHRAVMTAIHRNLAAKYPCTLLNCGYQPAGDPVPLASKIVAPGRHEDEEKEKQHQQVIDADDESSVLLAKGLAEAARMSADARCRLLEHIRTARGAQEADAARLNHPHLPPIPSKLTTTVALRLAVVAPSPSSSAPPSSSSSTGFEQKEEDDVMSDEDVLAVLLACYRRCGVFALQLFFDLGVRALQLLHDHLLHRFDILSMEVLPQPLSPRASNVRKAASSATSNVNMNSTLNVSVGAAEEVLAIARRRLRRVTLDELSRLRVTVATLKRLETGPRRLPQSTTSATVDDNQQQRAATQRQRRGVPQPLTGVVELASSHEQQDPQEESQGTLFTFFEALHAEIDSCERALAVERKDANSCHDVIQHLRRSVVRCPSLNLLLLASSAPIEEDDELKGGGEKNGLPRSIVNDGDQFYDVAQRCGQLLLDELAKHRRLLHAIQELQYFLADDEPSRVVRDFTLRSYLSCRAPLRTDLATMAIEMTRIGTEGRLTLERTRRLSNVAALLPTHVLRVMLERFVGAAIDDLIRTPEALWFAAPRLEDWLDIFVRDLSTDAGIRDLVSVVHLHTMYASIMHGVG